MARLGNPVEGVNLLQRAKNKCLPIAIACALVERTSSTISMCALNPLTESVVLYAGTTIAAVESIDPPPGNVSVVSSSTGSTKDTNKEELLWTLVEQTGEGLSADRKNMFYQLLLSYADVFASSTADLGKTDRCHRKFCRYEILSLYFNAATAFPI